MISAEKRPIVSKKLQIVTPFASVVFALVVGAVPLLLLGVNPFEAYGRLFQGAFGSLNAIAEVGVKAAPLLLTGLAVAIPLRAGLWNIGAEGQLYVVVRRFGFVVAGHSTNDCGRGCVCWRLRICAGLSQSPIRHQRNHHHPHA